MHWSVVFARLFAKEQRPVKVSFVGETREPSFVITPQPPRIEKASARSKVMTLIWGQPGFCFSVGHIEEYETTGFSLLQHSRMVSPTSSPMLLGNFLANQQQYSTPVAGKVLLLLLNKVRDPPKILSLFTGLRIYNLRLVHCSWPSGNRNHPSFGPSLPKCKEVGSK